MRTGKFTRVRYLRISRLSLEIVNGLTAQEKASFLDQCLIWFLQLEQGEEIELIDTDNPILKLALREEIAELQNGFITYMDNANKRKRKEKSGMYQGSIPDQSLIHQGSSQNTPLIHPTEQNKQKEMYIQNIEQIRSELVRLGYSADEIDKAIRSVNDWDDIQNKTAYVRKIIDNQRKAPRKILPAQDFQQRDYSGVDDELKAKLAAEMAEFKKNGGLQL